MHDPARATDAEVAAATCHRDAHLAKAQRRPADTLWRPNPRDQGLLGLTDAIAWFGARGWPVSLPLIDSQPYDLVVDDGQALHRVQVKTTTFRNRRGRFVAQLSTHGGNRSGHSQKPFDPASADLLYVLVDDGSRYLIPTTVIEARTAITLGGKFARYRLPNPRCGAP